MSLQSNLLAVRCHAKQDTIAIKSLEYVGIMHFRKVNELPFMIVCYRFIGVTLSLHNTVSSSVLLLLGRVGSVFKKYE
jgi:hypothetical protein